MRLQVSDQQRRVVITESQHSVIVRDGENRIVVQHGLVGPVGPQGPSGSSQIGGYEPVISNIQDGDVLAFSGSSQRWINRPQVQLTDGGNF